MGAATLTLLGSSFTSHKHYLSFPHLHYSSSTSPLLFRTHKCYYPTISASSTNKTRASRKVKSNGELCNDLREFISMVGLPEDHVPSMKELSHHGRQDLANIVRRRGYKLIKQLLSTSLESDDKVSGEKENLIELQDAGDKGQYESIGQEQKLEDMNEKLSDEVPEIPLQQSHIESASEENSKTNSGFDGTSNIGLESSLQYKVAKFMHSGELDTFEDDGYDTSQVISSDSEKVKSMPADLPEDSSSSVESEWASGRSNMGTTLNGSTSQSNQVIRDVFLPNGGLATADYDEESVAETTRRENESELDQLKFMLHQKEMELSQLKDQIEKEKLALSVLQNEAEKEIIKAQKLISDKDAELRVAEELISDLKEVQVLYMGDGETVQVAGSFNGWHHPITMDPQPSSNISDPLKSRNSRLWSTVLWLYPGTYEIKFVIDGHWRIDPQRETMTIGGIQNNVLRVDR